METNVEFRILGTLEVWRDGKPVAITGRVQPRLLAGLLLEAGHVVPSTKLIECVWGDAPPETARRQIQNAMSAMRRTLGDTNSRILEAVGEGYRVRTDFATLDNHAFVAAVNAGRELADKGALSTALDEFRYGLGLWRGHPLAGITGRVVEAGAQRLEEARLSAIEKQVDVRLRLGVDEPVIGQLRELLTRHPFRQRMAGQLMRALHRDGRTAEALKVYQELRTRLADELGIDPGQSLRDLHSAILREDHNLAAVSPDHSRPPVAAAAAAVMPRPAQLPADTASFTGRATQLAQLDSLLTGRRATRLATLSGIGGSGKTTLGIHWGHMRRDRFPDGQLYINLRGFDHGAPVPASDALSRLLTVLGQPADSLPTDTDEAAALYRSLLADRRFLLILDNAREVDQVRPLLPGSGDNLAIVTSRNRLTGLVALYDARPVPVGTLDRPTSVELLANLVSTQRLHANPEAAHRIADLCGGLPLALRIAGTHLAAHPHLDITEFAAELGGDDRLNLLAVDGDPNAAVAATFRQSFQALDPEAGGLFLRIGMIPGEDFNDKLAHAAGGGTTMDDTRQLLRRLEDVNLVEQHAPGRFRIHDLVRLYARQQAQTGLDAATLEAVKTSIIRGYYNDHGQSSPQDPANVIAAFHAWRGHRESWRLAAVLPRFLFNGSDITGLRHHVELAMHDVTERGEDVARAAMYDAMAAVEAGAGREQTALEYGRKAIAVSRGIPDGDANGRLRSRLAAQLLYNSEYTEAASLLRETLHIAEAAGDTAETINSAVFLGATLRSMGEFEEAELRFSRALSLAENWDVDPTRRVQLRFKLARLFTDTGRCEAAWRHIHWIEEWWQRHASDFARNRVLWLRGELHRRAGRYAEADHDLEQAWLAFHRANHDSWARQVRFAQIHLCCDRGRYEQAKHLVEELAAQRSADFEREDRAQWAMAHSMMNIGLSLFEPAVRTGEQACAIFAETGNPLRLGRSLVVLADAYAGLGRHDVARRHREHALAIFTRLKLPEAEEVTACLEAAPKSHTGVVDGGGAAGAVILD